MNVVVWGQSRCWRLHSGTATSRARIADPCDVYADSDAGDALT